MAAALHLFAQEGYDHTTIRAIARHADVDPALIMHFFGTKQELFIAVMAPPQNLPQKIARELAGGDKESLGLRLATLFVSILEAKSTNHIVLGAIKSAVRVPGAASLLRNLLVRPILKTFRESDLDNAELRAALVQSQLLGIVISRHILKVKPLAGLTPTELISYIAPTLQRYLTGDLSNIKEGI